MELKDIPESTVIQQVKQVIKVTGLKIQRINTGCFQIGDGRSRRYIKTADAGTCDFEGYDNIGRFVAIECKRPSGGAIITGTNRVYCGHQPQGWRGVRGA